LGINKHCTDTIVNPILNIVAIVNPNKICNKLVCDDYDTWWPVVVGNGSPALITFGKNTGWAENFSIPGKWHNVHQLNSTCMQLNWLYAEFTNLSLSNHIKRNVFNFYGYPLHSPISTHGKAIPHMENHAHMWKMDLNQE